MGCRHTYPPVKNHTCLRQDLFASGVAEPYRGASKRKASAVNGVAQIVILADLPGGVPHEPVPSGRVGRERFISHSVANIDVSDNVYSQIREGEMLSGWFRAVQRARFQSP
jgi:hypothetical protein